MAWLNNMPSLRLVTPERGEGVHSANAHAVKKRGIVWEGFVFRISALNTMTPAPIVCTLVLIFVLFHKNADLR